MIYLKEGLEKVFEKEDIIFLDFHSLFFFPGLNQIGTFFSLLYNNIFFL